MFPPQKKWLIAPRLPSIAEDSLLEFPPFIRQILYNRGYASREKAHQFLSAVMPQNSNPWNLLGMIEAIDAIRTNINHDKSIVIYGDYDVDGVTATALLVECLRSLNASVSEYIPNRFEEGYGLNKEALLFLKEQGAALVITVDCGIRSLEEANYAKKIGLDLIITDHHHPQDGIPEAIATINPKQPGDNYPDKDLAGVGIAYKLANALLQGNTNNQEYGRTIADSTIFFNKYLDLVSLGTVADLAKLVGENRALVRQGLKQLQFPNRQGLRSLNAISGIADRQIQSSDIGHILGPRLNAAGRLDSALAALRLLLTQDSYEAGELAQLLDNQNRERQLLTREMLNLAEEIAFQKDQEPLLIFVAHPQFNPGVVGLVASRLVDRYYKPSIIAHLGETETRGSCRSIPEFHITDALDRCANLLIHHGGHAAAAGFTIKNENLPLFMEQLNEIAQEELSKINLQPVIQADMEITLNELKPDLLPFLQMLQPTGYANPDAYFVSKDLYIKNKRAVGSDNAHLKMTVTDGKVVYDAIAFRQGELVEFLPDRIDLLYTFEKNIFNEREYLQLNVKDIKPTEISS